MAPQNNFTMLSPLDPLAPRLVFSPCDNHDPFNSLSILHSPLPSGLASPCLGSSFFPLEPSSPQTFHPEPRYEALIPRPVAAIHNLRVDTKAAPYHTSAPKATLDLSSPTTSLSVGVVKAVEKASISKVQPQQPELQPLQQPQQPQLQQPQLQQPQLQLQQLQQLQQVQQVQQVHQVQPTGPVPAQLLYHGQYPNMMTSALPATTSSLKRKRAPTEQRTWVLPYTSPLFRNKGIDADRRRAILSFCMQYPGQGFTLATILTHLYPGLDKVNRKRVRNHYAASWSLNRVERHLDKSATLSHAQGVLYRYLNDSKATFQFVFPAEQMAHQPGHPTQITPAQITPAQTQVAQ